MAKAKADKPAKEEKKTFTVADLATELGKEPTEVRAALRKAEIEKTDGKYQWVGQKAFDQVVKELSSERPARKAPVEDKKEKPSEVKTTKTGRVRPKPGGSK